MIQELNPKMSKDLDVIVQTLDELPEKNLWRGIVLKDGQGIKTLDNVYDIVIVSRWLGPFHKKAVREKLKKMAQKFTSAFNTQVNLVLHTAGTLKNAKPNLLNYELVHGHRVLKGPENVLLKNIPRYKLKDIPLIEGTRLLVQGGSCLLENKYHPDQKTFIKNLLKAYLAMGDSLMLVLAKYEVHPHLKKETMKLQKNDFGLKDFEWIRQYYLKALAYKENGDESEWKDSDYDQLLNEAASTFISFFMWYEEKRLLTKFRSIPDYVHVIEKRNPHGQSFIKMASINFYYFGFRFIFPTPRWLQIHPRNRLFPALILLLKQGIISKLVPQERKLLAHLCPGKDTYAEFTRLRALMRF